MNALFERKAATMPIWRDLWFHIPKPMGETPSEFTAALTARDIAAKVIEGVMTPSAGRYALKNHVIDAVHPAKVPTVKAAMVEPDLDVCCICKAPAVWDRRSKRARGVGIPYCHAHARACPDFHERHYDAHSWAEWSVRTVTDPPNTHPTWMLIWIRCSTPIRLQSVPHKAAAQRACGIAYQRLVNDVDDDRARDMLTRFVAGQTHPSLAGCINAALTLRPLAAIR